MNYNEYKLYFEGVIDRCLNEVSNKVKETTFNHHFEYQLSLTSFVQVTPKRAFLFNYWLYTISISDKFIDMLKAIDKRIVDPYVCGEYDPETEVYIIYLFHKTI